MFGARLRPSLTTRVTRSLSAVASGQPVQASARAGGSLSVKQRLRETVVPEDVLKRIRKLGVGHERGGAVRVSEEDLRTGRKRELGRMGLVKSAQTMDQLPPAAVAELALAGRSNVGKSSLLNALAGKRSPASTTRGLAPVQNRPGVTRALNFYGSERRGARIVDMPGYGFAFAPEDAPGKWQEAMKEYVQSRGKSLRVLLCIDARQSLRSLDREFLLMLEKEANVPYFVVMTKCDLVRSEELAKRYALLEKDLRELSLHRICAPNGVSVQMISSRTTAGIGELRAQLTKEMPAGWIRFPQEPGEVEGWGKPKKGRSESKERKESKPEGEEMPAVKEPWYVRRGEGPREEPPEGEEADPWAKDIPIGRMERRRRARERDQRTHAKNPLVAASETWARRRKGESERQAPNRGRSERRARFGV